MGAGGGVGLARELIDCPRGGQGLVGARAAAETSLERFHLLTATLRRTSSRSGRRCGRRVVVVRRLLASAPRLWIRPAAGWVSGAPR